MADQEYCLKMEKEVPITAQYLLDREFVELKDPLDWILICTVDGVKLNHHDEKNVFLEFNTSKQELPCRWGKYPDNKPQTSTLCSQRLNRSKYAYSH